MFRPEGRIPRTRPRRHHTAAFREAWAPAHFGDGRSGAERVAAQPTPDPAPRRSPEAWAPAHFGDGRSGAERAASQPVPDRAPAVSRSWAPAHFADGRPHAEWAASQPVPDPAPVRAGPSAHH
ncbi:hypothetical protein NN3_50060 [Nocardia neocaledoniensis NBRC 108232]|nr:hypothetical protein NN3_50060 [Nocardia neocaledoniensis NBRC 108232]